MKFWEHLGIGVMSLWLLYAVHEGVNALVRAHNWQTMTISDWGTWIGSIGTVGALIGTIWLATEERRRRNREAMDLATLTAASILLKIANVAGAVQLVIDVLSHQRPSGTAVNFRYCCELLEGTDQWTNEDLLPLIPLRNHTAANLALAKQTVLTARKRFEFASRNAQYMSGPAKDELIDGLRIALRVLETCIEECRRQTSNIV